MIYITIELSGYSEERLTITETDSYICWRSSVSITIFMTLMGFEHHTDTKSLRVDIYQYIVNVNAVPVQTKKGTCHVSRCNGVCPPVTYVTNVTISN